MPALAPVERVGLLEGGVEVLVGRVVEPDVEEVEGVAEEEVEEEVELVEGRTINAGLESSFAESSNTVIEAL
jgi:hypothetical protein